MYHYCNVAGCPGYPWFASSSQPHPCGREPEPRRPATEALEYPSLHDALRVARALTSEYTRACGWSARVVALAEVSS